jgi:two-component system, OmpR family, phosphate regulon response regulator PhoB
MKKKVLIIENDRDIRDLVEYILEEEGFDALSIPEPERLTVVLEFGPDVILIDEFVNNKPGHRLCLKIKQAEELDHIPVIILSTAQDIELIVTECKANDYIKKPFDVQEMIDKVMRVLDNRSLTI